MGLGILILVSLGKENIYLSIKPEITFFKIAYKRYTNFSIEPTPQYFKTTPDFGRRCTANISKNADLINMVYIYVELPDIQMENFAINNKIRNFAWVEKIGLALINYVEIEIGGTVIDRHYGDWLNIWNELTINSGIKKSYNKMIGNIRELNNYSKTKKSTILYIPLSFWFCQDTGLSLPLIGLLHNDVKIHVNFNDIDKCYNISPSHYINVNNNYCIYKPGEYFYQMYQNNKIIGEFIYFDPINQNLYYNPIKGKFIIPNNDTKFKLIGNKSNFEMEITSKSVVVEDTDYFKFNKPSLQNAYLVIDYIFLDTFERNNFLNNAHEYLIPIVQTLPEQISYSNNIIYKLPLFNPIKLIIWKATLLSNINSNNKFNYTTYPYTNEEENIINKNLLIINSINRIELDSIEYYTNIQKYQYNFYYGQKGIYMYSFCLNPKELQPSGSMNFSKVDDAYIQLKLNKLINYQNPAVLQSFAIQYNIFKTFNGIGGLTFNS